ncbi:MAG: type II secretion system secretin GspD [Deltaproteobacteria bacterium]|nr:type II secretion system secretin GspD [Deltaproteobacteria bacterium]
MKFVKTFFLLAWSLSALAAELSPATVAPAPQGTPQPPVVVQPPPVSGIPSYPPAVTLEPVPTTLPTPPPQVSLPQANLPQIGFPQAPFAPASEISPETSGVPGGVATELRPASPETLQQAESMISEEGVYFNVAEEDCREVIKQISRATQKNFLLDDKIRCKITIISERKVTKDELWEMFLSALEVAGYTVVQGPVGLHKLVPLRDAISSPIPMYLGDSDSPITDAFITRLIPLKNINATDMANAIKGMVSKEGNLFAYQATNTIIITDSGSNIDRIHNLVRELDKTGPQEIMEIVPIKYASAKDIADKIQNIFETDKGGSRPATGAKRDESGDLMRISKVIPDERTNSLIILASKVAMRQVHDMIAKLDTVLSKDSGKIHVHYLKNAEATEMAQTLTSLTQSVSSAAKSGGGSGGGSPVAAFGFELEGKVNITADKNTNSLVIMASQKDYETLVEKVVSKLDIPRRQVYVEAVVMELVIDQDQSLGIAAQGGFPFSIKGKGALGFGSMLGGSTAANTGKDGLSGGVVSTDTVTVNVTDPATGAAKTITVPKFFAALTAQQKNIDVNVLSTPNLLTMDNEKATIEIAQKEPFSQGQAVGQGGVTTQSFTREPIGLTLELTPQINEGDTVKLKLKQKKSDILNTSGPLTAVAGPSTKERSVETTVMANDGQTIVIGGLLEDTLKTEINKVPLLGDIPILGWLFKNRTKKKVKSNLLVFITPYIIRDVNDFNKILQRKIEERNVFIDKNYSKRQRKLIRESIESHAKKLLEYEGALPPNEPIRETVPAQVQTPSSTSSVESESPPPSFTPPPPEPKKQQAVVTPSPAATHGSEEEDIDLALPPGAGGKKAPAPMTPKEPKVKMRSPVSPGPSQGGLKPVQDEDIDLAY